MMKNKKLTRIFSVVAILLVLAMVMAGCTNPDDAKKTAAPETSAPAVNTETAPADTASAPADTAATTDAQQSAQATTETAPADTGSASPDASDSTTPGTSASPSN